MGYNGPNPNQTAFSEEGNHMNKKRILITLTALLLIAALTGCSAIGAFVGKLKGELQKEEFSQERVLTLASGL